jgi:hypothetical protein
MEAVPPYEQKAPVSDQALHYNQYTAYAHENQILILL